MQRRGEVLSKIVAVLIVLVGALVYLFSVEENPVTGERQRVAVRPGKEAAADAPTCGEAASSHS